MAIDAVSTGLLAAAALAWEGTRRATHVNTAVIILQLVSLCGEESKLLCATLLGVSYN